MGQLENCTDVRYTGFYLGIHNVCLVGVMKSAILLGSCSQILPLMSSFTVLKRKICFRWLLLPPSPTFNKGV